jgi:hypothetical protein
MGFEAELMQGRRNGIRLTSMRITSVRVSPVARILGIVYAVFGLGAFVTYAVSSARYLTLPFGVLAPLFHLNLNLNLARAGGVLYNTFLGVAAVLSYALTGWVTGTVAAVLFNVTAKLTGGIDAKYVSITGDEFPVKSAV